MISSNIIQKNELAERLFANTYEQIVTGNFVSKHVLHVGPAETRGGMGNTIQRWCNHPPEGWTADYIATHTDGNWLAKFRAWTRAKRQLIQRMKHNPPNIVHIHGATRASWLRKRKCIRIARRFGLPVVYHVHAGNFDKFLRSWKGIIAKDVNRVLSDPGITTIVLTKRWKKILSKWIPEPISIVPTALFSHSENTGSSRNRFRFLLPSRPSPVKGHKRAIEMTLELRRRGYDVSLDLSCVGPKHRDLKHVDSAVIRGHGWLSDQKLDDMMKSSGVLLVPSEFEGMPSIILEAMGVGLPVVASACCSDIFDKSGEIVPSLDPMIWADHLEAIISDKQRWESMSASGPKESEQYSVDAVAKLWERIYNDGISPIETLRNGHGPSAMISEESHNASSE